MPEPQVLHIDDGREWRGGQHQVALLAEGLAELGIAQAVATPAGSPLGERLAASGVELIALNSRGEVDFKAARRLADQISGDGFNILHTHTAHAHALGLRTLRRLQKTLKSQAPKLLTTRRVDFTVGRNWFSRRKYTAPGQHYIAISNRIAEILKEGGVASDAIDVVASGVPPIADPFTREAVRKSFGIDPETIALVNTGALTDHKGQRYLIEATPAICERFPEVQVWILGDGELQKDLKALVSELNLSGTVHLPGHIAQARRKLTGFDLYVQPSHLEGLGTSVLDAMLAGLPVVASNTGGIPDAVKHGRTGYLAEPKSPGDLADKIIRALSADASKRKAMITAASEMIAQNFSAKKMVAGNVEIYRKLLG